MPLNDDLSIVIKVGKEYSDNIKVLKKYTTYKNLWNVVKAVVIWGVRILNAYIKKQRLKTYELNMVEKNYQNKLK